MKESGKATFLKAKVLRRLQTATDTKESGLTGSLTERGNTSGKMETFLRELLRTIRK